MSNIETAEVSFLDALSARYGAPDDFDSYDASAFLVGDVGRKRNKKWELVGMEKTRVKQSRFDRLVHVVLRSSGMNTALKPSELEANNNNNNNASSSTDKPSPAGTDALAAARLVRLQELDLSENPELPFTEIAKLLPYFPSLEILQLTDVPQLLPQAAAADAVLRSDKLTKLVLNNVGFTSVCALKRLVDAPNLVELHLDSNELHSLSLFASKEEEEAFKSSNNGDLSSLVFPKVTTLSLAHNKISSWGADSGLGATITAAFPALTRLFLADNQLPNLILPDEVVMQCIMNTNAEESKQVDASLTAYAFLRPLSLLCLNDIPTLTDPRVVDAVRTLCPHLDVFRITYSTLLPHWNETLSRMYVVAALPTITLLNRGTVRPKERLDSEIFYIQRGLARREMLQKQQDGSSEDTSLAAEPQYSLLDTLHEKHKDLVISIYREGATASSDGSSHLMLNVTIHCENNYKTTSKVALSKVTSLDALNTVQKTLPSTLTIAKLKALVKMTFQIDPQNQYLSYQSGDAGVVEVPVPLDNEVQTLGYYGVSNGARIGVRDTSLR